MKSKLIGVLLIIMVILIASFKPFFVIAATRSELNSQSSDLDNQISEKKEEISHVEEQLSGVMAEIQDLTVQISSYESTIAELDGQITSVQAEITQTENDIAQKEKEVNEKQDLLNRRLVAIYESGNTSYLEMLLTSSDLSDFLSKYYLLSEIAQYDVGLITSLQNTKAELEAAKVQLDTEKQNLELTRQEQADKKAQLDAIVASKASMVAGLNSEERALQSELDAIESEKQAVQAELAEIARREAEEAARRVAAGGSSYTVSSPSSAGYIFPVAGCSKANINNKNFPSYRGHTGVDVNIGVSGKTVVAVKSGTVEISRAIIRNGRYASYGEYVVINHHDGTQTLYGHMEAGSRMVSKGDEVSQGQAIGIVGSTGNSTGPHLHFEVILNGRVVNPIPYLP